MTTNIQLLRSSIPYKRPSAAPLLEGQAAINYSSAEPGLFFRLTDGRLAKVGPVAVSDNAVAPNDAPAGETGNSLGEEWLDARPVYYSPIAKVFDGNEFVTANGFTVDNATGNFRLDRELRVNRIDAVELNIDGPAVIGGNITPNGQNCAYYVGKPDERWDNFFGCNLDISTNGLISNDLSVGRDVLVTRDFQAGRHVISNLTPDVSSVRLLGTSTQRWAQTNTEVLNVSSNTTLGTTCLDTITVEGTSTFKCGTIFEQPIEIEQIGTNCAQSLLIKATSTFDCPVTFNDDVLFKGELTLSGSGFKDFYAYGAITLGDGCASSTINLIGATTLSCDMLPNATNAREIGSSSLRMKTLFSATTNTTNLTGHKLTGDVTVDHDARSIGTTAARLKAVYAQDVYTGDLHLKNEKGDWTMIEDENYLTIRNNKNGKTFRLLMEEV